jgi:hypothetical protein
VRQYETRILDNRNVLEVQPLVNFFSCHCRDLNATIEVRPTKAQADIMRRHGGCQDPAGEFGSHKKSTRYQCAVQSGRRQNIHQTASLAPRATIPPQGSAWIIKADNTNPNHDCLQREDLPEMRIKTIKIKASRFPFDLRCEHSQGNFTTCMHGRYMLEKGGTRLAEQMREG